MLTSLKWRKANMTSDMQDDMKKQFMFLKNSDKKGT